MKWYIPYRIAPFLATLSDLTFKVIQLLQTSTCTCFYSKR